MDLNSEQKLFLHSVLFHYLTLIDQNSSSVEGVEELMSIVSEELLNQHAPNIRPEEPDNEYVDDFDDYQTKSDIGQFIHLPALRVMASSTEKKYYFTFVEDENELCFILSPTKNKNDRRAEFVGPVTSFQRFGQYFVIDTQHDGKFNFSVAKFPKEWTQEFEPTELINL